MKTEVILKETKEQVYLNDLRDCDHVGFIDQHGDKGFIIATSKNTFMAVGAYWHGKNVCNSTYGAISVSSLVEALNTDKVCDTSISTVYRFDTRKELYQWLATD